MISNKQCEKLEKDIKKNIFLNVNLCLELIKKYFQLSPSDAFTYLKEIMFFSVTFRNDSEIEIIKYYIKNLKKFAIGKYNFFYEYLINLRIIFYLKKQYRKKIKKLNILKSILISKASVEYLVQRTLQILGDLQEKRFLDYLHPYDEDMSPTIIIDNLRLLFNDLNELIPTNSDKIVTIKDVFSLLLQIDEIVSLENEVILFGIRTYRIRYFISIEDNAFSEQWKIGNGKKDSQDFFDRLSKEKNVDSFKLRTIAYRVQSYLLFRPHISYYLEFFYENEELFHSTYYYPIEVEINKLGMKLEEAEQICIFKNIRYYHFLIIFEFFSFCNYFFSANIKYQIEQLLKEKNRFIDFLMRLLLISKAEGEKILEIISSSVFEIKDLYVKPILILNDNVIVNIKQISYNRICRNLISNFYRYNNTGFNSKYRENCMIQNLIHTLMKTIQPNNLYTNIPFRFQIDEYRYSGDIDIIFEIGNDVFVFECKSVLNVVDYWEYQRISSSIRKGRHQVLKIKEYLKTQNKIKDIDLKGKNIIFAIITTTKVLSGKISNDVPVVPYEDIINLLEHKTILFYCFKLKKKAIQLKDLKNLINDVLFNKASRIKGRKKYQQSKYKMFHFVKIDPDFDLYAVMQFARDNGFEVESVYGNQLLFDAF